MPVRLPGIEKWVLDYEHDDEGEIGFLQMIVAASGLILNAEMGMAAKRRKKRKR